jgi:hypothetical protein
MPGERGAENGGHADRVLVDVRLDVVGPDRVLAGLQRDDARLHVEVAAELLPDDVHVAAEHEIRARRVLAGAFAPAAPLPLQRERAEHDGLRGPLCARAGGLARGMEQVGDHADAALLDLRRLRILRVVDEVAVQVLRDHALRLGLHPGGHERREVAHRDAVEHELLVDQPHCVDRAHSVVRQAVIRRRFEEEAVPIGAAERVELLGESGLPASVPRGGLHVPVRVDRHGSDHRRPALGRHHPIRMMEGEDV